MKWKNIISVLEVFNLIVLCEDTAMSPATSIPCVLPSSTAIPKALIPNKIYWHDKCTERGNDGLQSTTDDGIWYGAITLKNSTLHCIVIASKTTKIFWKWKIPDSVSKEALSCGVAHVIHEGCIIYDVQLTGKKFDAHNDADYVCVAHGKFGTRSTEWESDNSDRPRSDSLPAVQMDNTSISVMENMTATWHVKIRKDLEPKIRWYKNRSGLDFEENSTTSKYSHYTKRFNHFFSIKATNIHDTGYYTIEITSLGIVTNISLYLDVQDLKNTFNIVGPEFSIEGDNVTLICTAPLLTYKYDLGWVPKDSQVNGRITISRNATKYMVQSNLTIENLTQTDAGNYSCQATRKDNSIKEVKSFNMVVVDSQSPSANYTNMNGSTIFIYPQPQNDTIALVCKADGLPEPKIIWTQDGKIITNTSNLFELLYKNTTLRIKTVFKYNYNGTYECTAENRVARVLVGKLIIEGKDSQSRSSNIILVTCSILAIIVYCAVVAYIIYKYRDSQRSARQRTACSDQEL